MIEPVCGRNPGQSPFAGADLLEVKVSGNAAVPWVISVPYTVQLVPGFISTLTPACTVRVWASGTFIELVTVYGLPLTVHVPDTEPETLVPAEANVTDTLVASTVPASRSQNRRRARRGFIDRSNARSGMEALVKSTAWQ